MNTNKYLILKLTRKGHFHLGLATTNMETRCFFNHFQTKSKQFSSQPPFNYTAIQLSNRELPLRDQGGKMEFYPVPCKPTMD